VSLKGDSLIGSELAGYRIVSLLGSGGMSTVYLAEDERLGRKVALKLLARELAEDDRFRKRFLRESKLAASIDHSSIVPVYEAGEAEGVLYIAMRRVEGTDMRELLRREGPLEPQRALVLLGQVGDALDAAHERGLVHRDVKPSNVLVARETGREHCYLSDFGLTKSAASLGDLTEAGHLLGTIDYVAPEQIEGATVDGRADVYSLACVLFESLTGQVPFPRESDFAVLWAHVQDPPPSPHQLRPQLPAALDPVIATAMAKERDKRYTTCAELMSAAWAAQTGQEETAFAGREDELAVAAEGAVSRSPRSRRRTLLLAPLVGVLIAVAAAISILALGQGGESVKAVTVQPNSVAVIDPDSNEVVADVPVGNAPTSIAVGEGAVWVLNSNDSTVSRIDPETFEARSIGTGATPSDLAVGGGAVWLVTHCPGTTVLRIELPSNTVERVLKLPPDCVESHLHQGFIAYYDDALWVGNTESSIVYRIDPEQEVVTAPIPRSQTYADNYPGAGIAGGEGAVWVNGGDYVTRVDPVADSASAIDVPHALGGIAAGEGGVWVASTLEGLLWRIDTRLEVADRSIPVGDGPLGVAVGGGSVWTADSFDGTVSRIDPAKNEVVRTIEVGNTPRGVAVGEGFLWVTVG
jgi:YVTN family beta-propeller protein